MAGQTIFADRRVFPEERAAQLGVAFVAFVVDGLCRDEPLGWRSVRVVTTAALNFSLPDRVTGALEKGQAQIGVARSAGLELVATAKQPNLG